MKTKRRCLPLSFLSAFAVLVAAAESPKTDRGLGVIPNPVKFERVDPCELNFVRLASRRFVLDNELLLAEYEPTKVVSSVQHPTAPFDAEMFEFAAWWPCAHYRLDVESFVSGAAVKLAFAAVDGRDLKLVTVRPGEDGVPLPPFQLSALANGLSLQLLVTKDGSTRFLRHVSMLDTGDWRLKSRMGAYKAYAGGRGVKIARATASLTAGYGQADVRFVTTGRGKRLYFENGRVFFTASSRGGGAMVVASFDPSRFDVRLEGAILFDPDDGILRADGPADLFYDDVAGEWRAWVCNFSTLVGLDGKRKPRDPGGINVAWSKKSPLHGLSVMRCRSLGLQGMNEDPTCFYDAKAGKWRLFLSEFSEKKPVKPSYGIYGSLWESDNWDGPFVRVTPTTDEDSTGQGLVEIDGVRWALAGSLDQACHVYEYPSLKLHGDIRFDLPPWNKDCPNGRVWATMAELPDGYPFKYIFLTMDRALFPGVPKPNWTYGALYLYGANADAGRRPNPTAASHSCN